jgi:hypothetical protein
MSTDDTAEILKNFAALPDSAFVPITVAAAHDGVSARNVRRTYPRVKLSPNRWGVNVGYLRSRRAKQAAT